MKTTKTLLTLILMLMIVPFSVTAQTALTLDKSLELAQQNNIKIRNAANEVKAAREVKKDAFTKYFPNINAQGMALRTGDPILEYKMEGGDLPVYDGNPQNLPEATEFAYFPGVSISAGQDIYLGTLMATQPIFVGGRIVNGNKLAALGVDVNQTLHVIAKRDVLVSTEHKFWQIVSLEEKLKTIEAYNDLLLSLEKQVLDAYNSGLVLKNDLLKVQLKLSEVQLNITKLKNGRILAMMAFCQYIGVDYYPEIHLEYKLEDLVSVSAVPLNHKLALANRQEFQLLQKSVEAEHLQTLMTTAEYLPSVALGAGAYYAKIDDYDNVTNTVAFATVSVPISDCWGGSHKVTEHRLKERIAKNTLTDMSQLLILQMDKAWRDLSEAGESLEISRQAREQAVENLMVNQDAYANGMVTVSDLLEAQALLQQANDRLTDARTQYKIRNIEYLKVTGRLN